MIPLPTFQPCDDLHHAVLKSILITLGERAFRRLLGLNEVMRVRLLTGTGILMRGRNTRVLSPLCTQERFCEDTVKR
jgi:hypothetical protein